MPYLPGGQEEYLKSLRQILSFITDNSPSETQIEGWFFDSFNLTSVNRVNYYLNTLEKLELIIKEEGKFKVTKFAEKISSPHFVNILFELLKNKYFGFQETYDTLCTNSSLTLDRLMKVLKEKGIQWNTTAQYKVRLNWLLSLGYITKKGPVYSINERALKTKTKNDVGTNYVSHEAFKKMVMGTGRQLGLTAHAEYPLGSFHRLDVVWIPLGHGIPIFGAEIQINENDLEKALTRLSLARNEHIFDLCLYTKDELIKKATLILNKVYPELSGKLIILPLSKIAEELDEAKRSKKLLQSKFSQSIPVLKFRTCSIDRYRKFRQWQTSNKGSN